MGTTYSVKHWSSEADVDHQALQAEIDLALREVNDQMSTYLESSEISRFNRSGAGEWFAVSTETVSVVDAALRLHGRTDGALDVTVGPLLTLWGFGPGADPAAEPPGDEELAAALALVGVDKIETRADPPALRKTVDGVEIDLSAIAKGYAVDLIAALVVEAGAGGVMAEIGGEVVALGTRADGEPWRIGVERPDPEKRTVAQVLPLRDLAMATSGDYRNYRGADGERYCHIVDPRTSRPLPYRGFSVTVLAQTCREADGLATALVVLGPAEGYDWCVKNGVAAMFLMSGVGDGPEVRATPAFPVTAGGSE
ncbi:MAG: FAD:protein FMN transferase [Planctomycetota bacterium]